MPHDCPRIIFFSPIPSTSPLSPLAPLTPFPQVCFVRSDGPSHRVHETKRITVGGRLPLLVRGGRREKRGRANSVFWQATVGIGLPITFPIE